MVLFVLGMLLAPANAGDAHPYRCCSKNSVDDVVDAWLEVHEALTASKPSDAAVAKAMADLAEAAEAKVTPEEQPALDDIESLARAAAAQSVPEVRGGDGLGRIAGLVAWLSLRYEGGTGEVVQARCAGLGVWLQQDVHEVKNPWGRSCGRLL